MSELSYCGFNCALCPVYLASRDKDNKLVRLYLNLDEKLSDEEVREYYCFGCVNSNSRHLTFCEIKKCAEKEKKESCAFCNNFPCEKLAYITEETKEHLIKLRDSKIDK